MKTRAAAFPTVAYPTLQSLRKATTALLLHTIGTLGSDAAPRLILLPRIIPLLNAVWVGFGMRHFTRVCPPLRPLRRPALLRSRLVRTVPTASPAVLVRMADLAVVHTVGTSVVVVITASVPHDFAPLVSMLAPLLGWLRMNAWIPLSNSSRAAGALRSARAKTARPFQARGMLVVSRAAAPFIHARLDSSALKMVRVAFHFDITRREKYLPSFLDTTLFSRHSFLATAGYCLWTRTVTLMDSARTLHI